MLTDIILSLILPLGEKDDGKERKVPHLLKHVWVSPQFQLHLLFHHWLYSITKHNLRICAKIEEKEHVYDVHKKLNQVCFVLLKKGIYLPTPKAWIYAKGEGGGWYNYVCSGVTTGAPPPPPQSAGPKQIESDSRVIPGSSLTIATALLSFSKAIYPHLLLSTQVNKWGPGRMW